MLDSSVFFKRIDKNKYIYYSRGFFSKYGYILNYKEKVVVENLLDYIGYQALPLISISALSSVIFLSKTISWIIFLTYLFAYYKIKFKKIINKRERFYCGRLYPFEVYKKHSKILNLSDLFIYLISSIGAFIFGFFLLKIFMDEKNITWLIIGFFILLASICGLSMILLCIYYKEKSYKEENKK